MGAIDNLHGLPINRHSIHLRGPASVNFIDRPRPPRPPPEGGFPACWQRDPPHARSSAPDQTARLSPPAPHLPDAPYGVQGWRDHGGIGWALCSCVFTCGVSQPNAARILSTLPPAHCDQVSPVAEKSSIPASSPQPRETCRRRLFCIRLFIRLRGRVIAQRTMPPRAATHIHDAASSL